MPIQNKVAEADLGADRAQLQQERLRLTQMEAQAAASARHLQEQLLSAELEKFRAGFSTNFAVIQQQAYLAQAETSEIAAQATWKKAGVQLDRALACWRRFKRDPLSPVWGRPLSSAARSEHTRALAVV